MTLKSRKVYSAAYAAISLIIVSSLVSSPLAQRRVERLIQLQQAPQQASQLTEEEKKAAKELEGKTLALVDELATEAMSLKLVENRVYILTGAAEALWKRDEERARALIREAMNQVVAHMREAKEKAAHDDGQYFDPRYARQNDTSYLRGAVLNSLAMRDAKMALEFLQTMRTLRSSERANPGEEHQERELELRLAAQIAGKDPQTALRIAEEYLDGKWDYQIVNIWSALQREDPKAASPLTDKIISNLKSQDILSDYNALNLAFNMLSQLKSYAAQIANARNNQIDGAATNTTQVNSAQIQQAYRETLEVVAAATLRITVNNLINPQEADRARNLLSQIQNYLPEIEKLLPSRAAAVRAKLAQFDKVKYRSPHERFYAEYGNDLHNKPVQELLALAAKAPQEVRQNVYHQAVYKAIEAGDEETARKIVKENVPDKWQANSMLADIERRNTERAVGEGKFADARRSLARMRTDEQRATALAGWATAAMSKGDKKSALEMLQEARALIGARMQRSDQLEAQIAIANVAVNLDPDASFEIAEAAIERLNRLVSANLEMQNFAGMEEEEVKIMGGGVWGGYSGSITQLLPALARKDFDRAGALLKRWQSNEIRLMMGLTLAQSLLSEHGVGYGSGVGIGIGGPVRYIRRGAR